MTWEIHRTVQFLNSIEFTYFAKLLGLKFYQQSISTNIISEPFVVLSWLIIEQMLNHVPKPIVSWFYSQSNRKNIDKLLLGFWTTPWAVMIQYSCQRLTSTHHNSEHLIRDCARKDFHRLNILEKKIPPSPKHLLSHNETLKQLIMQHHFGPGKSNWICNSNASPWNPVRDFLF